MTTQLQKQREKSFDHIFNWAKEQFSDMVDLFTKKKSEIILETARRLEKEGCELSKISNEIATNLSGYIDHSYVNKVLKDYPQYKEQYRVDNVKKRNSSRNIPTKPESPTIEAPTAKVEPSNEELGDVAGMAANILNLPGLQKAGSKTQITQQPNKTLPEQPGPKEVQGIHNIDPSDYKIDELEQYDKSLLIEIVKVVDEANTGAIARIRHGGSVNEDLRRENETLRKQVESVKPFVELFSTLPPENRESWLQFMKNALEREKGLQK